MTDVLATPTNVTNEAKMVTVDNMDMDTDTVSPPAW
jgi:hypothetical protein